MLFKRSKYICIGIYYLLLIMSVYAQQYDLQSVVRNISIQIDPIKNFLMVLSYVIGVGLCVIAIMKLKKYGTKTAFMHVEMTLLGPFLQFFIGVGLFYLPTFITSLNQTVWQDVSGVDISLGYESESAANYIAPILGIIQIIGLIAFLRGWVQISRATNAGNQPGVVSKALTYIIGGLLAINIQMVICTFNQTLLGSAGCGVVN